MTEQPRGLIVDSALVIALVAALVYGTAIAFQVGYQVLFHVPWQLVEPSHADIFGLFLLTSANSVGFIAPILVGLPLLILSRMGSDEFAKWIPATLLASVAAFSLSVSWQWDTGLNYKILIANLALAALYYASSSTIGLAKRGATGVARIVCLFFVAALLSCTWFFDYGRWLSAHFGWHWETLKADKDIGGPWVVVAVQGGNFVAEPLVRQDLHLVIPAPRLFPIGGPKTPAFFWIFTGPLQVCESTRATNDQSQLHANCVHN